MALSRFIMALMAITEADLTSEVPATPLAAGGVMWALRGVLIWLADLLLPPVCIGGHGLLCGDCWARIDFIAPLICPRLGVPLPYDTGEPCLSAAAIAEPPVYDRARAVARYSSAMRDLIP